jgi:hypothetical protein
MSKLKKLSICTAERTYLDEGDLDWIQRKLSHELLKTQKGWGSIEKSLTQQKIQALIEAKKRKRVEITKEYNETRKLHEKHGIPLSQHQIPPWIRQGDTTSMQAISESQKESSKIVEGIDFEHWGQESDLLEQLKKLEENKTDSTTWPEMERLEIVANEIRPRLDSITSIISAYRPDIYVTSKNLSEVGFA